jgi:hypothetical protein
MTDMIADLAKRMRESGIEHLELENSPNGKTAVRCMTLMRSWEPPETPVEGPEQNESPIANALVVAAYRAKADAEARLKMQAAEDAVRFAHTEGLE